MPETQSPIPDLQFLKLGGSLITDKARPGTPRIDVLARLAAEIDEAITQRPDLRLVLGHGSGSFGHVAAHKHDTRKGVTTAEEWKGFAEVWYQASALNRLVVDALHGAGLPVIAFPPSASITACDGQVADWDIATIRAALRSGLLPVVNGDVVFDTVRGGTILSTEDVFSYLAQVFLPRRLLLAGLDAGVWADHPTCSNLIPEITNANIDEVTPMLSGSDKPDVTGGMAGKVVGMFELVQAIPGLQVLIFSGEVPGLVKEVLLGASVGTVISG